MQKILRTSALFLIVLSSCQKGGSEVNVSQDARFTSYITGFTSGIISKKDNITIRFAKEIDLPENPDPKLMQLSPAAKGTIVASGQSLIFSPEESLTSGIEYGVKLDLAALTEVKEGLEEFVFAVSTIPMDYEVRTEGLRTADVAKPEILELSGTLSTSDHVENDVAEKMLQVSGKEIQWDHRTATSHAFLIKDIARDDERYQLKLIATGDPIGVDKKGEKSVDVPSIKDFTLTSATVQKTGAPFVSLLFSDPIQPNQDLEGLVQIDGATNPRFVIDGNQVQVYLTKMLAGSRPLRIEPGIKNVFGHPLTEALSRYLAFDPEDPQIKLIGKGSILPSTDGLVLPFEAVNIKRLKIDVIQVFEQNVPQFFQVNEYDGQSQMTRAGRNVMSRFIDLSESTEDLSNWNRFTLDLASLFEAEKGAIYQVKLSFRPEDSVYPCDESPQGEAEVATSESWSIFDGDNFNSYYSYYYYPRGYRWDERDNPCHVSYYTSDRFVTRNLIASDIGLITKIGADNSLRVYTTNMVSASPVAASVRVLDYQLQLLDEGQTSSEGMITFNPVRRPFLVIAESNGQKSYLKLDDASSLTMSNFDVSGTRVKNGIKGYIYGERGVWRPGNNIYLSFMLEDIEDRVPDDQPVILNCAIPPAT